jgi:hypothetical protein
MPISSLVAQLLIEAAYRARQQAGNVGEVNICRSVEKRLAGASHTPQ